MSDSSTATLDQQWNHAFCLWCNVEQVAQHLKIINRRKNKSQKGRSKPRTKEINCFNGNRWWSSAKTPGGMRSSRSNRSSLLSTLRSFWYFYSCTILLKQCLQDNFRQVLSQFYFNFHVKSKLLISRMGMYSSSAISKKLFLTTLRFLWLQIKIVR